MQAFGGHFVDFTPCIRSVHDLCGLWEWQVSCIGAPRTTMCYLPSSPACVYPGGADPQNRVRNSLGIWSPVLLCGALCMAGVSVKCQVVGSRGGHLFRGC